MARRQRWPDGAREACEDLERRYADRWVWYHGEVSPWPGSGVGFTAVQVDAPPADEPLFASTPDELERKIQAER